MEQQTNNNPQTQPQEGDMAKGVIYLISAVISLYLLVQSIM